jgi:hypothetical protein
MKMKPIVTGMKKMIDIMMLASLFDPFTTHQHGNLQSPLPIPLPYY